MKLADIFQDGAVLQRGKESKIWGEDPNGTHVKAVLKGKTSVIAETSVQNGKFMLTFPAMEAQKDVLLKLVNDRDEVICLKDLAWRSMDCRRTVQYGIPHGVGCGER